MKRLALACTLLTGATLSAQTNTYPFPASGNVGIGTNNPAAKLTLVGGASDPLQLQDSSGHSFRMGPSVGTIGGFQFYDDVAAAIRLRIDNSGNIGIGTTDPQGYRLKVVNSYGWGVSSTAGYSNVAGERRNYVLNAGSGDWWAMGIQNSGAFALDFLDPNGGGASKANSLTVATNGNVGVGTASPGGKLQIHSADVGSVKTYSTSNAFGLILDQYYSGASEVGASYTRTADIVASTGDISSSQIRFLTKPANANPSVALLIGSSGNVGIGTTNPGEKLTVAAPTGGTSTALRLERGVGGAYWNFNLDGNGLGFAYNTQATSQEKLVIASSGNVGIGEINPTHKLAVNGTIKAKEIIVETTGWSDYVFADDYALQSLAEVEAHIKANKHLPGIPSAAQVATEGVSLGELQAKLLAKIEELTLHQIAQQKLLSRQEALLETQAATLTTQSQELQSLRSEVRDLRATK